MTISTFDETKVKRDGGGRFDHKSGLPSNVFLNHEFDDRPQKPALAVGQKKPLRPAKTSLRATRLPSGEVEVRTTDDEAGFSDVYERANFLAARDKIRGIAERVEGGALFGDGSDSNDYKVRLSVKDGPYLREAEIDYGTDPRLTDVPTAGDTMGALAETAAVAEQYSMEDVEDFAQEYGYRPEPGPHPYAEAEAALAFAHESKTVLTILVGEERYGDYVFGDEKAQHGYTTGTRWLDRSGN